MELLCPNALWEGAGPINVRRGERSKLHLSCETVQAVCAFAHAAVYFFSFFPIGTRAGWLLAAAGLGFLFSFCFITARLMCTGALAVMKRHN